MRLVDADSLKYRRANYGGYDDVGDEERKRGILFLLKEDIAAAPTIDPVRHGRWIWDDEGYHCSECFYHTYWDPGEEISVEWRYCPNCGAKMDGGEE